MSDERLKGLLSALWSFLQHSPITIEGHLTALEDRLRVLEARVVGDLKAAVDTGVVAVEETVADVESRLEQDFDRAIRSRVVAIQARLETAKKHVVDDLKRELRRVALVLALAGACCVLALIGAIFGLMAAWTGLKAYIGSVGASSLLGILFLVGGVAVFGLLRSVLHRAQLRPGIGKIAP